MLKNFYEHWNQLLLVHFESLPASQGTAEIILYHGPDYELMSQLEELVLKIHGLRLMI